MVDAVLKMHEAEPKSQNMRGEQVKAFFTQEWNKGLMIGFEADNFTKDIF